MSSEDVAAHGEDVAEAALKARGGRARQSDPDWLNRAWPPSKSWHAQVMSPKLSQRSDVGVGVPPAVGIGPTAGLQTTASDGTGAIAELLPMTDVNGQGWSASFAWRRQLSGRPDRWAHRFLNASGKLVALWTRSLPPHRSIDKATCTWFGHGFPCHDDVAIPEDGPHQKIQDNTPPSDMAR